MATKKTASKTRKSTPKAHKDLTPRKNPQGGAPRSGSKLLVK